eukprot:605074-Prymnesium_polylepis.1
MLACQWRHLNRLLEEDAFGPETVQELLDKRSDPNLVKPDTKCTALFFAVKYADLHTVEVLIAGGAMVSARDAWGRTALVNATERCLPGVIPLLLSKGLSAREGIEREEKEGRKVNAAEIMMLANETSMISWQNMGPPDRDAYILGFQQLLQAGATLSGMAKEVALRFRNSTPEDPSIAHFQQGCMVTDYKFALAREAFPVDALMAPKTKEKSTKK